MDNKEIQATLGHKTRKSGQYRDTGNIGAQDEKEWTIKRYRQHWGTRRERKQKTQQSKLIRRATRTQSKTGGEPRRSQMRRESFLWYKKLERAIIVYR